MVVGFRLFTLDLSTPQEGIVIGSGVRAWWKPMVRVDVLDTLTIQILEGFLRSMRGGGVLMEVAAF